MKKRLLNLLVCPSCAAALSLEAWQVCRTEIVEGLLHCRCGEVFPIIGGVPRMLPRRLRPQLHEDYAPFFVAHHRRLPDRLLPAGKPGTTVSGRTQRSFGFEWTHFSAMRPEWERNFWDYMAPHHAGFLRGKTILDAGCGMGRHLYYSGRHGRDVVGVDFSRAVDAAQRNTRHLAAAHVVQADLRQLPFRAGTFDFIYCLGVMHHLPNPDRALRSLLGHLKPRGELRVYVYWNLNDSPRWKRALLAAVTALRRLTTRLPHRLLSWLCCPIAAGAWITFVLPCRWLSRFRPTRRIARNLPLTQYAQYPFGVLLSDQFDRFSAPLEKRYGSGEVRWWLENARLEEVTVAPHWGWLGHGRKSASSAGRPAVGTPEASNVESDSLVTQP
jgi:SAM-dependent methyltransferase